MADKLRAFGMEVHTGVGKTGVVGVLRNGSGSRAVGLRADMDALLLAGGSMAGLQYVNANMGYDLQRDFTPVSLIVTTPWAFVINPALPVKRCRSSLLMQKRAPAS